MMIIIYSYFNYLSESLFNYVSEGKLDIILPLYTKVLNCANWVITRHLRLQATQQ
jgi:hypothetical protein